MFALTVTTSARSSTEAGAPDRGGGETVALDAEAEGRGDSGEEQVDEDEEEEDEEDEDDEGDGDGQVWHNTTVESMLRRRS